MQPAGTTCANLTSVRRLQSSKELAFMVFLPEDALSAEYRTVAGVSGPLVVVECVKVRRRAIVRIR